MTVQHTYDEKKGKFFITDGDKEIAQMVYVYSGPHLFIIEHTEVSTEYEGKGLGRQMVNAGVAFARDNDYKILPLCPFAKAVFDRVPEFGDVVFKRVQS